MPYRKIGLGLCFIAALLATADFAAAETPIRDYTIQKIAHAVWYNKYYDAIAGARALIAAEPDNPVGPFILGTIYQTLSEKYRNDSYADTISLYLNRAIDICESRMDVDPDNPDWQFIAGASYGYRALLRAFHGGWWGAFKDGFQCSSHLHKALELDSTYYDAYLGLGSYHYWKTIKSKDFLWLPFVSDRREQGIAETKIAVDRGNLASHNARESLLRIYLTEKKYDDLVVLSDSLEKINPGDPYCLLYRAQALIEIGRLDDAEESLRQLRIAWKKSPYFDPFGFYDVEYYLAQVFHLRGDNVAAQKIIEKILSERAMRKSNAYFAETVDRAEALQPLLK